MKTLITLNLKSINILVLALWLLVSPGNAMDRPAFTTPTPAPHAATATQTVRDFLRWYKASLLPLSRIILVDQPPGKPYSVNVKNTERYLTHLKNSHLLTDRYLNEWRTFFKQRQAGFQLTHQNEGPPTGFEYDLVMLSQQVDMQMDSLKTLKITSTQVRQNRASVKFFLLEDYEFKLVKQNNRWVIDEILNLSAE